MHLIISFEPADESLSPEMAHDVFLAREHRLQELIEETFDEIKMRYKGFDVMVNFPSVVVLPKSPSVHRIQGSTPDTGDEAQERHVLMANQPHPSLAADGSISESRPISKLAVDALNGGSREEFAAVIEGTKDCEALPGSSRSCQRVNDLKPQQSLSPTPASSPLPQRPRMFGDSNGSGCDLVPRIFISKTRIVV